MPAGQLGHPGPQRAQGQRPGHHRVHQLQRQTRLVENGAGEGGEGARSRGGHGDSVDPGEEELACRRHGTLAAGSAAEGHSEVHTARQRAGHRVEVLRAASPAERPGHRVRVQPGTADDGQPPVTGGHQGQVRRAPSADRHQPGPPGSVRTTWPAPDATTRRAGPSAPSQSGRMRKSVVMTVDCPSVESFGRHRWPLDGGPRGHRWMASARVGLPAEPVVAGEHGTLGDGGEVADLREGRWLVDVLLLGHA